MDPRLYGDEHQGMSHNERIYESAVTGAHPAKGSDDWERDENDKAHDGVYADDDE